MRNESYPEFVYRHCGANKKPVLMLDDPSRFVCPDGATIMAASGVDTHEPPADPDERKRLILAYKKAALQEAEEEFTTVRNNLVSQQSLASQYSNLPSVDSDAILYLNGLKANVEKLRREVSAAEAAFAETPMAAGLRQRQEDQERQATGRARLLSNLSSVNI